MANVHNQVIQNLSEVSRAVRDYSEQQKEKQKQVKIFLMMLFGQGGWVGIRCEIAFKHMLKIQLWKEGILG